MRLTIDRAGNATRHAVFDVWAMSERIVREVRPNDEPSPNSAVRWKSKSALRAASQRNFALMYPHSKQPVNVGNSVNLGLSSVQPRQRVLGSAGAPEEIGGVVGPFVLRTEVPSPSSLSTPRTTTHIQSPGSLKEAGWKSRKIVVVPSSGSVHATMSTCRSRGAG